jgi:hypothetical protein
VNSQALLAASAAQSALHQQSKRSGIAPPEQHAAARQVAARRH